VTITKRVLEHSNGNQHGYKCPSCKRDDGLHVVAFVRVALLPDGCDTTDSDVEWEDSSPADCECGWSGKVSDLLSGG